MSLYLQSVLGFSPMATGLAFLSAGVGGIAGGQLAIRAIRRVGLRSASAFGPALIALGCGLLTRITPAGGVAWVIVGYLIASFKIGHLQKYIMQQNPSPTPAQSQNRRTAGCGNSR